MFDTFLIRIRGREKIEGSSFIDFTVQEITKNAPMMNKTKWNKLCVAFGNEESVSPPVIYKVISSGEEHGPGEVWWHELVEEGQDILWLDLLKVKYEQQGKLLPDREIDISPGIVEVLERVGVRYSDEGKAFRVSVHGLQIKAK